MVEGGTVQRVIALINDQEDIAWQAMGTLRNLVIKNGELPLHSLVLTRVSVQVHQLLVEKGGISTFREALGESSHVSERTRQLIVQTLYVITSTNVPFRDLLREQEIFPRILFQLQSTVTEDFQSAILRLFVNLLAKQTANQDRFRELGGVGLLMTILQSPGSSELRSGCATALWAATVNNQESIDALSDEDITFISKSLMLEPDTVNVGIVATLSNIASISEAGQSAIRDKDMIPMIVDFLRGSHPPLLEATAGTVMALCKKNGWFDATVPIRSNPLPDLNTKQVLASDGALLLARNLSSPNSGVQQNAAGALRALLEGNFGEIIL